MLKSIRGRGSDALLAKCIQVGCRPAHQRQSVSRAVSPNAQRAYSTASPDERMEININKKLSVNV